VYVADSQLAKNPDYAQNPSLAGQQTAQAGETPVSNPYLEFSTSAV
jgi:hypothetical protein